MSKTIILGSIAGITGTGTCGYAAYKMMQPSNVRESLIRNGFKLTLELGKPEREKAWNKVLETYKVEASEKTKIENKATTEITAKDIEDWCLKAMDIKTKDKNYESIYSKAALWCVIYTSISEQLKFENKTLSTDTTSLSSKYDSMPQDLKTAISGKEGEKVKNWCEKTSKRFFLGPEDTNYKNLVNYCLANT
ncbi:hypothetical protein MHC_03190 [Mycoplasma haemocanis str. Illinois]|uniref:Uncharacterized protein n=1 Tax=Mycoplasma haemocanis (strain Illinois) TaxID=1111676 RepID=H6N776_MYCHN|nr:hypothetical protein [Mycoplasma haemocanis]AEW45498.1 hypothetical protein MHC_03190 [Mycoplasma haemocanis str. Illinois]